MGRLRSFAYTLWALVDLFILHPIQTYRGVRALVRRFDEYQLVMAERGVCPDCLDEGYCDYHSAAFQKVIHDDLGYIPDIFQ